MWGTRGGAGVWLHSLCAWLDFTSSYIFTFHEAPSMVVQGQGVPRAAPVAGCPTQAGLTPPATLSLTESPQVPLGTLAESLCDPSPVKLLGLHLLSVARPWMWGCPAPMHARVSQAVGPLVQGQS